VDNQGYAKYGVTRGALGVETGERKTVIVIAQGWPSWAFAVEPAGFALRCLVLLNEDWLRACEKEFGGDKVMMFKEFLEDTSATIQGNVVISDVDPPAAVCLWKRVRDVYVGRRSIRRPKSIPMEFKHMFFEWDHVKSGGVTDGSWGFNFYVKSNYTWHTGLIPPTSRQDMSCVINPTVGHGLECPPPRNTSVDHPRVIMLRPRTFHGGGLFPFGDRTGYFVVPSVFTKTKWCRRHLTADETLRSLDIGDSHTSTLMSSEKARLCKDTKFIPAKVSIQLLRGIHHLINSNVAKIEASKSPVEDRSSYPEGVKLQFRNIDSVPVRGDNEECQSSCDPTLSAIGRQARIQKATKSDDAQIPTYLWNDRVKPEMNRLEEKALETLRRWMHRVWCKLIRVDFIKWFRQEHSAGLKDKTLSEDARRDLEVARDCISCCWGSDWWEWKAGSRPHFWRWPEDYQEIIRDGLPVWIKGSVTPWRRPQPYERDDCKRNGMRVKITVPRQKGYIIKGPVFSLTSYFAVPKGLMDIRMVYDGTKSGFNGCCWAPWFMLPTVDQHLRATLPGSFMGDLDIGEMFLNFILSESVQKYCGIDLTNLFPEEVNPGKVLWERWG
jgi:hypothetical protein